jgi:hypothetical protein
LLARTERTSHIAVRELRHHAKLEGAPMICIEGLERG